MGTIRPVIAHTYAKSRLNKDLRATQIFGHEPKQLMVTQELLQFGRGRIALFLTFFTGQQKMSRTGVPADSINRQLPLMGSKPGFTLVEVMIVVAIIGLLAAIAVPNFVRARTNSQRNLCINNLRQIDAAKQQWAFEFHATLLTVPDIVDIQPYLGHGVAGSQPTCPADGQSGFGTSYAINEIQTIPTCRVSPSTHLLDGSASQTVPPGPSGPGGGNPDPGGGDGGKDGGDGNRH